MIAGNSEHIADAFGVAVAGTGLLLMSDITTVHTSSLRPDQKALLSRLAIAVVLTRLWLIVVHAPVVFTPRRWRTRLFVASHITETSIIFTACRWRAVLFVTKRLDTSALKTNSTFRAKLIIFAVDALSERFTLCDSAANLTLLVFATTGAGKDDTAGFGKVAGLMHRTVVMRRATALPFDAATFCA